MIGGADNLFSQLRNILLLYISQTRTKHSKVQINMGATKKNKLPAFVCGYPVQQIIISIM